MEYLIIRRSLVCTWGGDPTHPGCIQVYSFKAKRVIEGVDTYRVLNEVPSPWKPFPREYFIPEDADNKPITVDLESADRSTRSKAAMHEKFVKRAKKWVSVMCPCLKTR